MEIQKIQNNTNKNLSLYDNQGKKHEINDMSFIQLKAMEQQITHQMKYFSRKFQEKWWHNFGWFCCTLSVNWRYKLYSRFGGFTIVDKMSNYGFVDEVALILSWDPSKISNFFKKAFLS